MIRRQLLAATIALGFATLPAVAQTTTSDGKNGHHYSGGPKTEVPHHMGAKEDTGPKAASDGGSHHYTGGPNSPTPHHIGPKKN